MVPGRGCRVWHIPGRCRQPPPLRLGHGQSAGHLPRSPHKVKLVPRAPPPAAARWGEVWANEVWAGDFGRFRVIGGEKGRLAARIF